MQSTQKIAIAITTALASLGLDHRGEVHLEHPTDQAHGDYASNIAMQLFGQLSKSGSALEAKNPRELAQLITDQIQLEPNSAIASVAVAGPGFINFTLSDTFLLDQMAELNQRPDQDLAMVDDKTAVIEYMQPNTNKPLHIGHLRNAVLGEALIRIMQGTGWQVHRATVNNDRGLHITKSMWAYLVLGRQGKVDLSQSELEQVAWPTLLDQWVADPDGWILPSQMTEPKLQKPDHFVGHWYVQADSQAENPAIQVMWQQMLIAWEEESDPNHHQVRQLWQQLNDWFYQGYQQSADKIGFSFDPDQVSYESDVYQAGKQIVIQGAEQGVFQTLENGAIQANLEPFELPNKVLLRGDGTGIYMTFDIELTRQRTKLKADELIWVVGSDQNLYFQQLFAVCELLGYGQRDQFMHFGYGMVRLPEGKMSSRKGLVVYADDILDQASQKARQIMTQTGAAANFTDAELLKTAEIVGLGAVKWSMLSQDPLSNMTFDVDTSVSFTGFAGPYVQYTAVRCRSVLAKATTPTQANQTDWSAFQLESEERAVLRQLYQFPEHVQLAAASYAPHHLCSYLFDLAREYGAFYNQHQILLENDRLRQDFRLYLTQTVAQVLETGLNLLGISLPAKM